MKKIGKYLLVLLGLVVSISARSQNPFQQQIDRYPQEKLHVTTDKEDYILGDTIWLRVHSVDAATHQPIAASRYVYVELRTPEGSLQRRIKLLARDSIYYGYFPTQALEYPGNYSLVAYTMYMRNQGSDYFFKKSLTISSYHENRKKRRNGSTRKVADFDVAFFPEGGYLIDGYDCCVAFKALGDDGNSVDVTGVVKNDKGKVLDTLRTLHAGMGVVHFTPRTGESYYAECRMQKGRMKRFPLPVQQDSACVLKILQTDENFTVMPISGSPLPPGLKLLVHCRGNICYHKTWHYGYASLIFRRSDLPGGVLQVLLLDKEGRALSERLVFNRGRERAATDIEIAGSLQRRTKVRLEVTATEPNGTPAQGNVAISVTDRATVPEERCNSIYSTLLLTSDLRGYIETPDWYFAPETAMRTTALDALLLTQGWRRYDVPALMRAEYAETTYPLEVGQEIAGRINKSGLWSRKKRLSRYEMRMIVPSLHYVTKSAVNDEGEFSLNGFDFPDSTLFVLQPAAVRGSLPDATVKVVQDSFPDVGVLPRTSEVVAKKPYVAQARYYIEQRGQTDMRNILIDTIVVTANHIENGIDLNAPEHRLVSHTWTDKDIKESGAGTILDFISRMPGMVVIGSRVWYRGKMPVFMVDGQIEETFSMLENPAQEISYFDDNNSLKPEPQLIYKDESRHTNAASFGRQIYYTDDYKTLPLCLSYPLSFVARIGIIEGGNTALWGPGLAKNGIISITLKRGNELNDAVSREPSDKVGLISPLGYQTPAEFYAPTYETEKARRSMVPDYRTTLYWNPAVELDETGHAVVEFYTSDAPADYNVIVEGVSQQGKIITLDRPIGHE